MSEIEEKLEVNVSKVDVLPELSGDFKLFYLNYGILKKASESSFDIVITPKEGTKLERVKAGTSCGCTTAQPRIIGNSHHIKVTYDTKRLGNLRKSIGVTFILDGELKELFFKLIGRVIS